MAKTLKKGDGLIAVEHVRHAAESLRHIESDMASLRGDSSGVLRLFEDRGGNKAALRFAVRVANMEPERQQAFVRACESYLHILGVYDQGDMFSKPALEAPEAPEADEKAEVFDAEAAEAAVAEDLDLIEIEEMGKQACREGKSVAENPYDEDDPDKYSAWQDGFNISLNKGEAPEPEPEAEADQTDAA